MSTTTTIEIAEAQQKQYQEGCFILERNGSGNWGEMNQR